METIEGPLLDSEGEEQRFVVHYPNRDVAFALVPEDREGLRGWAVRIDGVPEPSIAHDRPWPTPEAAREAALGAIEAIMRLEAMQQAEVERGQRRMEP